MLRDYLNSGIGPDEAYGAAMTLQEGESPFKPEYEEFVRHYPGRGTLKVQLSVARGAYPIKNAMVDVSQVLDGVRYSLYHDVTDISGVADNMVLPAKSIESALNADADEPEAAYSVTIFHPDFEEITDCAVVIHDKIETILPLSLVPKTPGPMTGEGG